MQVKFLYYYCYFISYFLSCINRNNFLYYSDMPRCFLLLVYESVSITRTVLMLTN